jgi:hypothetical protein
LAAPGRLSRATVQSTDGQAAERASFVRGRFDGCLQILLCKSFAMLSAAGFAAEKFEWSVNFRGSSNVSIQLSTAEVYQSFPDRAVAADVHGILFRVAALEDTLTGKLLAWADASRRQSKRIKDLADIVRLIESHPELWPRLPAELQKKIDAP